MKYRARPSPIKFQERSILRASPMARKFSPKVPSRQNGTQHFELVFSRMFSTYSTCYAYPLCMAYEKSLDVRYEMCCSYQIRRIICVSLHGQQHSIHLKPLS